MVKHLADAAVVTAPILVHLAFGDPTGILVLVVGSQL